MAGECGYGGVVRDLGRGRLEHGYRSKWPWRSGGSGVDGSCCARDHFRA